MQQSEERTLPATHRKLREARKKGQVARSHDFISGASFLLATLYIYFIWPTVKEKAFKFVDYTGSAYNLPFSQALNEGLVLFGEILIPTVIGFVIVTVIAVLLGGMFSTFGPVFSMHPLKPSLQRINPLQGLGRIFSLRALAELVKSLIKVTILALLFWYILHSEINSLLHAPTCGDDCTGPLLLKLLIPMTIVAALAFLVIGLLDLLIQRSLFLREMRMTHTELKQERKNQDGNPLVRREQRRLRRSTVTGPVVRVGMQHATVAIFGDDHIVGLRYAPNEMPVPMVVSVTSGAGVRPMVEAARAMNIITTRENALATQLAGMHRPGERLNREVFSDVADVFVKYDLA